MKFKIKPEDFQVRELAEWEKDDSGDINVYRIQKRKLTTFDAIDLIREATGLQNDDSISYAGLKDRQAVTYQYVGIKGREIRDKIPGLRHEFVGKTNERLSSKNLLGNEFRITVRDIMPQKTSRFFENAQLIPEFGLPNYFDDQRFSTMRSGQGFIARDILNEDFDQALRRLLAAPGAFDDEEESSRKAVIRKYWGRWQEILEIVRGSRYQSILQDLARHPGDYRGALDRMPDRVRAINLLSYQSYLWNETVNRYLEENFPRYALLQAEYSADRFLFWRKPINDDQRASLEAVKNLNIPLINHETHEDNEEVRNYLHETLEAEGLHWAHFKMRQLKNAFYKEVQRPLFLKPEKYTVNEPERDELNKGRHKIELSFTLPPGSYATLVLKRIFRAFPFEHNHRVDRYWHMPLYFDDSGRLLDKNPDPSADDEVDVPDHMKRHFRDDRGGRDGYRSPRDVNSKRGNDRRDDDRRGRGGRDNDRRGKWNKDRRDNDRGGRGGWNKDRRDDRRDNDRGGRGGWNKDRRDDRRDNDRGGRGGWNKDRRDNDRRDNDRGGRGGWNKDRRDNDRGGRGGWNKDRRDDRRDNDRGGRGGWNKDRRDDDRKKPHWKKDRRDDDRRGGRRDDRRDNDRGGRGGWNKDRRDNDRRDNDRGGRGGWNKDRRDDRRDNDRGGRGGWNKDRRDNDRRDNDRGGRGGWNKDRRDNDRGGRGGWNKDRRDDDRKKPHWKKDRGDDDRRGGRRDDRRDNDRGGKRDFKRKNYKDRDDRGDSRDGDRSYHKKKWDKKDGKKWNKKDGKKPYEKRGSKSDRDSKPYKDKKKSRHDKKSKKVEWKGLDAKRKRRDSKKGDSPSKSKDSE